MNYERKKNGEKCFKKCVTYKRYQGRAMAPPVSPDLPNYKIDSLFSFKATGLDYPGPLYVRTCEYDAVSKVYILC